MSFSPELILTIILIITIAGYIFDQALDYLNLKSQKEEISDDVASFYDREKYTKSLAYHKEQTKFSFVASAFSFVLSLGMLVFGGFGWLDDFLRNYIQNEIILTLTFFGVLMIVSDFLTTPFQYYSTFVIEEKYGFNKTTMKTFILDKVKGYLLGAVVGGLLITVLLYLVHMLGESFWIWFALIAAGFILFVNMFYTSLILPLFNKLTPLPEGDLKVAIEAFSKKINFPLDNIFVIDGSKRSKKANAFFSGIGKKKKIVLYDTLIDNHTTEELVAVLAHEVGHFKKKHIIFSYVLSVIQIFFTLNLLAFGILFSPISGITGIFMNIYSRKNEFEADAYAHEHYGSGPMISALKKLSVDSLSDLYPHPLYVFFHYSHPPLLQRLEALKQ